MWFFLLYFLLAQDTPPLLHYCNLGDGYTFENFYFQEEPKVTILPFASEKLETSHEQETYNMLFSNPTKRLLRFAWGCVGTLNEKREFQDGVEKALGRSRP